MSINHLASRAQRFLAYVSALLIGCGGFTVVLTASTGYALVSNDVMNFHFDESAGAMAFDDLSAANLAAFCSGSACPKAGEIGLRGTPRHNNARLAIDFDGVDDCLTIADNPAHEMSFPLSMSVWILPRQLPAAGAAMAMLSKYRASGNQREWILGIRTDSAGVSRLAFWQSSAGTSASTTAVYSNRQLTWADLNRWMHVVLRIDAAGQYQWWMNGTFESQGPVPSTSLFKGSASVRIGCVESSTYSPDFLFRGKIDEILVAKSYVTDADIRAFYDWSKPVPPTMAYVDNPPLLPESCQIDTAALATRVRDLGTNLYRFTIRRPRLCSSGCIYSSSVCTCAGSCDDFSALRTFLAQNPRIKVIVERNPFWYSIAPTGASPTCLSKPSPEEVWGCAIGELARQYPNLVGWSLDDFFSKKMYGTFLDPFRAKAACAALRDPAAGKSHVKVYATIYCNKDEYDACARALGTDLWWPSDDDLPTGETAFVAYVNSDPELRACITGVSLYTDPAELTEGSTTINRCIGTLRALQVEPPILEIIEGVYISDKEHNAISCDQRRLNVRYSQRTYPDGFAFYLMPVPSDASCPGYSWLKQKTISPSTYIQW